MLAKTKVKKLKQELEETNARVRNLSLNECLLAIEAAEAEVKELPVELRDICEFEYNPHEVASSYSYPAQGTALRVRFNKAGKAVTASVSRENVYNQSKKRLHVKWGDVQHVVEAMNEGNPVSEKLVKLFLRSNGFNPTHLIKQMRF